MQPRSNSTLLTIVIGLIALTVVALAYSYLEMYSSSQHLSDIDSRRLHSYQLATELRQSSDDLTRLGRVYVVTGDPEYEREYLAILDIRNGKLPRPVDYHRIYWDFVAAGDLKPRPDSTQTIPLQELMKKAGFTEAEFAKLKEAQANSDGLVGLEVKAMNAVKGKLPDGSTGKPDMELARTLVHSKEYHQFKAKIMKPLDEFFELMEKRANSEVDQAQASLNSAQHLFVILILALIVFMVALIVFGRRQIYSLLGGKPALLSDIAGAVAGGQLDVAFPSAIAAGSVLSSVETMVKALRARIEAETRISQEMVQIKLVLDSVSTGVMIADKERKIIYANKSVQRILKSAEAAIRRQLPNFNADRLIGVNIDTFHKNPVHQANLLTTLTSTYTGNIEVSGRHLRVVASPVINERNERLGSVAEWLDRTPEVLIEQEIANIVAGAQRGDFTQRLRLEGKEGFFLQLAEGMNSLCQTTSTGLSDVARVLQALAKGDLTLQVAGEYAGIFGQLKDDSNVTVERLREIIGNIKDATDTINTAATEIASGNQDLSQRTEEQASSLEETASSMEELTSTVKQNAENAKQANQLAIGASDIAGKGGAVVGQVVTTMNSINESSRKIVDIISVIDGIAFQTNILALNAAVEAARAGEQGRGFAVVAGEVRNLAQRSAAAAKEIKTLIGDSVEKVEGGSKLVAQAGQTMAEIVCSIKRVTDIMSEITAASLEQSQGIEQVNTAITQMDQVIQQNAALVEEAAAAAESLQEQAQNLAVSVGTFKMDNAVAVSVRRPAMVSAPSRAVRKGVAKAVPSRVSKAKPADKPKGGDGDGEWAEF